MAADGVVDATPTAQAGRRVPLLVVAAKCRSPHVRAWRRDEAPTDLEGKSVGVEHGRRHGDINKYKLYLAALIFIVAGVVWLVGGPVR